MSSLEEVLAAGGIGTMPGLAAYLRRFIDDHWHAVLLDNQEEFVRLYERAGEGAAYGTYAQRLFRPLREELTGAGLLCTPAFPGTLTTSREWGPPEMRERWMWSVVRLAQGPPLGTLVVRLPHDHTRFALPRPPGILALVETDGASILRAVERAAGQPAGSGEGRRVPFTGRGSGARSRAPLPPCFVEVIAMIERGELP